MLSVVIPSYRKPDLLERTLSALAEQQTDEDFEVVVVDDGSQDGRTPDVIQRAGKRLRVRDAGIGTNEGRARARNRGWRAAQGRWVLFLDDDIVLRPGALQSHVRAQRDREAAYLGSVVTAPEIVDSPLFDYLDSRGVAKCEGPERVPSKYLLTQNVSVPRASLEMVDGFDEEFGAYGFEDMEIAFRLEDQAELEFFSLPTAVGEHVHHHTLDEYLEKKRICGRETLPQLARLHPHRLAEMKLDVLPGFGENADGASSVVAVGLRASWAVGGATAIRWLLRGPAASLPRSLRHRLYDYAVLSAYAEGLRESP